VIRIKSKFADSKNATDRQTGVSTRFQRRTGARFGWKRFKERLSRRLGEEDYDGFAALACPSPYRSLW